MIEPLVLCVDDEPGILRLLKFELVPEGFRVVATTDADTGLAYFREYQPDIILLDILMPGKDGYQFLADLRQISNVPVIFLSAKGSDIDKVRGLDMGADDYLAKPFSPDEILARIRAVLRRTLGNSGKEKIVQSGELEINLTKRIVRRGDEEISLSKTEWNLIQVFLSKNGGYLLPSELLIKVWGTEYRDDNAYLWRWIGKLRKKIERDPKKPEHIITDRRIGGYKFNIDD